MQSLQCDLRLSAAKHNSITHAAATRNILDATIPLRSADTALHENETFVRGFFQIPLVEKMKMKLSCEASFKFHQLKWWKWSFRGRLLSNSTGWRDENEAFVRDFFPNATNWRDENEAFVRGFLQIPRVEEMKKKFSCKARQSDDARNRRASDPTFLRSGSAIYPKKYNISCKS